MCAIIFNNKPKYKVTNMTWKKQVSINYLWTYDLYGPVCNAFDGGKSITRAIGRVGPSKFRLFWALKKLEQKESCLGPKKSRLS